MKIIKRDGTTIDFDSSKIVIAIQKVVSQISDDINLPAIKECCHNISESTKEFIEEIRSTIDKITEMVKHYIDSALRRGKCSSLPILKLDRLPIVRVCVKFLTLVSDAVASKIILIFFQRPQDKGSNEALTINAVI